VYPRQIGPKLLRWLRLALLVLALGLPAPATAQTTDFDCVSVGEPRCLRVATGMVDAVDALTIVDIGPGLLRNAADKRVTIRVGRLDRDLRGLYSPATRTITISRRLARRAVQVRALILAHELQHATEALVDDETSEQCFLSEEAAFRVEARVWPQLFPGRTPPNLDEYHREANALVRQLAQDPEGFVDDIRSLYEDDCGDQPDDSDDEG
jgi:hypothetical protein